VQFTYGSDYTPGGLKAAHPGDQGNKKTPVPVPAEGGRKMGREKVRGEMNAG